MNRKGTVLFTTSYFQLNISIKCVYTSAGRWYNSRKVAFRMRVRRYLGTNKKGGH